MSDRTVTGAVAGVGAILTLLQLFWMFGMMSPASVVGGHANGALIGSLIAAWFWVTFTLLAAAAIILLMTRDETTRT
jgi:uncharacterized membrane protein YfcA